MPLVFKAFRALVNGLWRASLFALMLRSKNWVALAVVGVIAGTAWILPASSTGAAFIDSLLALLAFSLELSGGANLGFLFIILSLGRLPLLDTVLMADAALMLLAIVRRDRPDPLRLLQAFAATTVAAVGAHLGFDLLNIPEITVPADYIIATSICFAGINVFSWKRSILWTFPYYLVAAAIAAMSPIPVVMPLLVFLSWQAYRAYERRLQVSYDESQRISDLHLRTMQTLALAIEARDTPLNGHTRRVSVYTEELAKEMELPKQEREALRVASLLYDIGELAVPEHILAKPGKLTPEEFDKIRIHPQVGAEILARVNFPYPVSPIVLAHHERWNGSGYPKGLIGEEIPRTARILAVADAVDALASPRHYRKEMSIDDAVAQVVSESGQSFDPMVVSLLSRHYKGWERRLIKPQPTEHFNGHILLAAKEAQVLADLTDALGSSLDLDRTYLALESAIGKLIPNSGMILWLEEKTGLCAEHIMGGIPKEWKGLQMPIGGGISGYAACGDRVLSGPAVLDLHLTNLTSPHAYEEVLVAPLKVGETRAAFALYRNGESNFNQEHTRIMGLVAPKLGAALSVGLKYRQVKTEARADSLTGLPNAAALAARMQTLTGQCAVVVCDLDGFKLVNDRFGHVTGNRVLQDAGEGFRNGCREEDFVARLGGDEFVLLLSGVTPATSGTRLIHFERMIREVGQKITGTTILSGSFGVSFFPQESSNPDELLKIADFRMYQKKGERSTALPNLNNHLLAESRVPEQRPIS